MSCERSEQQELFSEARRYFSALIAQSTFQNMAKTSTLILLLHKGCAFCCHAHSFRGACCRRVTFGGGGGCAVDEAWMDTRGVHEYFISTSDFNHHIKDSPFSHWLWQLPYSDLLIYSALRAFSLVVQCCLSSCS